MLAVEMAYGLAVDLSLMLAVPEQPPILSLTIPIPETLKGR